jgi:hypothetical protein
MRLKTIRATLPLAASLLTASLPSAWADSPVYRWKDASGQVHYSQTPPTSGSYDVMQGTRAAPATPPPATPATPASPSQAATAAAEQRTRDQRFLEEAEAARKAKAEAKAKEKAAKADKDQRCKLAQETANALKERHAYVGMNVEEFTRRMDELRQDMETHCG